MYQLVQMHFRILIAFLVPVGRTEVLLSPIMNLGMELGKHVWLRRVSVSVKGVPGSDWQVERALCWL